MRAFGVRYTLTPDELRSPVFACTHCEGMGLPFVRDASGKFYRFPPTIGAVGRASLLFVGINPRVSASNRHLHQAIVQDAVRFGELARNRIGVSSYIGLPGLEQHYAVHARVAQALYPAVPFEQVAAVTELFHCASASSTGLPSYESRCAALYLPSVLELVCPAVVFAVGKHVADTLRGQFGSGSDVLTWSTGRAPIIELPHPNSFGPKLVGFDAAVAKARRHLQKNDSACAIAPPSEESLPSRAIEVGRSPADATRGSQRAIMQRLFVEHGRDVERVVAAYADAERAGRAVRSSNNSRLSPEQYARALLSDGLRKGWLNQ